MVVAAGHLPQPARCFQWQTKMLRHGGSQIPGLAAALERVLADVGGGSVRIVDDPVFAGSNGGLALAHDASDAEWEQLGS